MKLIEKLPCKFVTNSSEETEDVAFSFSKLVKPFSFIALFGEMGAGKTAFTKGFAAGFGLKQEVFSPTFSLINEYFYSEEKKIVHCDMYRVQGEGDVHTTGFLDYLGDENAIVLVEWSEKILSFLPEEYYRVEIKILNETKREIKISEEKL